MCRFSDSRAALSNAYSWLGYIPAITRLSGIGIIHMSIQKPYLFSLPWPPSPPYGSFSHPALTHSELVALCFDCLGHRGSHFFMKVTNLEWVPKCKLSTLYSCDSSITQCFIPGLPRLTSSPHASSTHCPSTQFSIANRLVFLSSQLRQCNVGLVKPRESSSLS